MSPSPSLLPADLDRLAAVIDSMVGDSERLFIGAFRRGMGAHTRNIRDRLLVAVAAREYVRARAENRPVRTALLPTDERRLASQLPVQQALAEQLFLRWFHGRRAGEPVHPPNTHGGRDRLLAAFAAGDYLAAVR